MRVFIQLKFTCNGLKNAVSEVGFCNKSERRIMVMLWLLNRMKPKNSFPNKV